MRMLGQHTLLDFYDCDPDRLKRARAVRTLLCSAVREGGGKIVKAVFHNFSPYGVSGVVVITQSHVTIHTWPEHGYAAVDVFSCSPTLDPKAIRLALIQALGASRSTRRRFPRGTFSHPERGTPSARSAPKAQIPARLL